MEQKDITIRKLDLDEWEKYKAFRLEALKESPTAFATSYDEDNSLSDLEWQEKLKRSGDGLLFAFVDDKIVGMLGYFVEKYAKHKHSAVLHGFYVDLGARGVGVGSMLMEKIINKIKKEGFVKAKTFVYTSQDAAVGLYEKFGFEKVGKFRKELFVDDKYYDEWVMEKMF